MKMSLFRSLALATALGLGAVGAAAAAPYTALDAKASSITFGYSQMNVKMDGRFGELKAREFRFDPAQPGQARVHIEVALGSVDAGYEDANAELRKDEWLALDAHPLATFVSRDVRALGDGRFEVTGELSVKGNTREVSVPVVFQEEEGKGVFTGSFTFQRADFGIGQGQWKDFGIVANDIEVGFQLVARSS